MRIKRFLILLIAPALVLGIWLSNNASVNAQSERICVCHVEDKKANTGHVIEIDVNSLVGHCAHGDDVVDCGLLGQDCTASGTGLGCE